jgi:hypothetical protein
MSMFQIYRACASAVTSMIGWTKEDARCDRKKILYSSWISTKGKVQRDKCGKVRMALGTNNKLFVYSLLHKICIPHLKHRCFFI